MWFRWWALDKESRLSHIEFKKIVMFHVAINVPVELK